ncbi:hypothetical protein L9F63_007790 [Diploptera punctata]|uniref:Kazal-like domain-containing protein n=1 Tax=Diploptera punctata TaxID=6984 RepID=A0AAD7Z791_DIPPU|nr:hypothetical protein L9F63_007790 [Diploptera punctata]
MKKFIIVLIAFIALSALAESKMESGFCPCPRILNPVCGTDSRTYANPCEFECAVKQGRSGMPISHTETISFPIS